MMVAMKIAQAKLPIAICTLIANRGLHGMLKRHLYHAALPPVGGVVFVAT